ncbi:MAG: 3'-5' exonuclease [Lentisphaeria bacterium]
MQVDKPFIIFDLESTGLNPRQERIVEIGAVKIMPDGEQYQLERRLNPECPIPPEVTAIHGISDADVAGCPTFADIASELEVFFAEADLGGFGIARFDVPLLRNEFSRVGIDFADRQRRIVDAKDIYHRKEPRDLTAALKFFCDKDHVDAHGAMADTVATLDVLLAQLEKYKDLPHSVEGLEQFCNPPDPAAIDMDGRFRWHNGEAVIAFGQKSGTPLKQLAAREPGYLKWMLNKDFAPDAKAIAEKALQGVFPDDQ